MGGCTRGRQQRPTSVIQTRGRTATCRYIWLFLALMLLACPSRKEPTPPPPPTPPPFTPERASRILPPTLQDRLGWSRDIFAALEAGYHTTGPREFCAVAAILEQESGFVADPAVPGLSKLVQDQLQGYAARLGPFGPPLVKALLKGQTPGTPLTFQQRLEKVKTERDLDLLFRDMLRWYREQYPKTYKTANFFGEIVSARGLEELNPITTAGSMQVSVRYAMELASKRGRDPDSARDELYTRAGGVYYGVSRLFEHQAAYPLMLYRFADYNAGLYASRNAALQAQLSRIMGTPLITDGDLLSYDKAGEPTGKDSSSAKTILAFRSRFAPQLTEARVRRELLMEKRLEFERTEIYLAIKDRYQKATGQKPVYAQLPEVTLKSAKLKNERTTAWFARSVDARFQKFYQRYKGIK